MDIKQVLQGALDAEASDIFIISGIPLTYKVHGQQHRGDGPMLMPEDTRGLIDAIYALCNRKRPYNEDSGQVDDDFSFALPGMGRFRANVFSQRGSLAAVLRVITFGLPDAAEMHIPQKVLSCADFQKGLVLVTGSAGSGKSTTLACLIDAINKGRETHIITMEDPIEYIFRHDKSIVTQREISNDTESYATALRAALREAPNVILLGEMRDTETIEIAMTAAETGQLLFSTLHTVGAANTVDRIVDVFPANQQHQIRVQLSMVLQAVISQQLVPTTDGRLVPAFEIMFMNPAIRNLIRESKTYQIDAAIQTAQAEGMCTMDDSLLSLFKAGTIEAQTVLAYCVHPEAVAKKLASQGA